jgi:two-component system, cell cycle response regulator DivK
MSKNPMTVLLVDDDLDAQSVFELVMQHYKVPFKILGDAESALDFLKTNVPDIIVMDIFLPGIDGYQALDRIRRSATASGTRVIATTAYYTNDTQQEVIRRGFDGYVPKPFDEGLVNYLQHITGS